MCGRYYVDDEMMREMEKVVQVVEDGLKEEGGVLDVYPSQLAAIIIQTGDCRKAKRMRWGFLQYPKGSLMINARAETVTEKPTFRESVENRRAVIPARGFYEWGKKKEKAAFFRRGVPVLYMAGIYKLFEGQERFAILTTQANTSVAPVHERMPLLLEETELEEWLRSNSAASKILKKTPPLLECRKEYEQQELHLL